MRIVRRALAVHALVLPACTVGPDYHPPQTQTPPAWIGAEGPSATALADDHAPEPADLSRWWAVFGDPTLDSLIERAAGANLDLVQAEARVREARASRAVASSGLWPSVDVSASYTRSRSPSVSGPAHTGNFFQEGFDAAWEVDVFGGIRRGVEAADADLASSIEDRRSVLVSLCAEVAVAYFDLRTAQDELAIARRNLTVQQQSAKITRQRWEGGFVSKLDVANAEGQVAATLARIPAFETVARQSIYALAVLLALEPGALIDDLSPEAPLPPAPPSVPAGLPSDILRRRPDIRRAEADLHAATARIGVATADLFPKFSLTGSLGLEGSAASALTSASARFWSFGPSVSWPIFAGGRIRANVGLQEAVTDERYAAYQKAVLVALQEVESSLVAFYKERERGAALADSVKNNREAVDLATQLYTAGRTDFLNVLNAQRSLLDSEDAASQSARLVAEDLVALYKALGGGWDEPEPEPADEQAGRPSP